MYDTGGNIGYISILFATLGAQVVGVEPTALREINFAFNRTKEFKTIVVLFIFRVSASQDWDKCFRDGIGENKFEQFFGLDLSKFDMKALLSF